jgi:hypothetical protein
MDESIVTVHRLVERVRDLLPRVELSVDEEGQIVLCTGLFVRPPSETVLPRPARDEPSS